MNGRTMRMAARLAGLVAVASVASGCGLLAGPSEPEAVASMIEQASTTNEAFGAALDLAVSTRSTMSADFRTAAGQMETAITDFNELSRNLNSTSEVRDAAEDYAQAANLAAGLLADGAIDVAAEVGRTQVEPKYAALQSLLTIRQEEVGEVRSGPSWWPWLFGLPLVAFVVYVVVQRRRPSLEDLLAQPNAVRQPEIRNEPGANANRRKRPIPLDQRDDRSAAPPRDLPPPIGDRNDRPVEPTPARAFGAAPPERHPQANGSPPTGPVRNPEAIHSVKGGLRTVELRGIIDAALATMADAGWEVAIECPDVSVLVDPLRMRRLLSNLLLSATAHGAEHIGLVAVIVEDRVEVNIGHDGSLLDGAPETTQRPPEVEHQLTVARQLLAGMHADARWTNWRGVSLYTIELVRGPDEVKGHDVPAAASAD